MAAVVDVADAAGNTAPYVLAAGTRARSARAQRALGALPPRRPRVEGAPEVLLEEPVAVVGRGAQCFGDGDCDGDVADGAEDDGVGRGAFVVLNFEIQTRASIPFNAVQSKMYILYLHGPP